MNELEVINFQSHPHSYLSFHPKVNIIRGTSNHGKSALVRAIAWAVTNQPRGTSFCNWNKTLKDGVEVNLSFNKGTVSRIVNNKFNGYRIFDNDTEEEAEFEALRNDVPNEVRVTSDNMDESNIYNQDDGYFLLQETPGNIARKLNERSGLGDIDTVAKVSKKLLDECSSKLKYFRESLKDAESEVIVLSEYEKLGNHIKAINDYFRRSILIQEKADSLESRIETLKVINAKIEEFKHVLKAKQSIKELAEILEERLEIAAKHTRLGFFVKDIKNIQKRIDMFKDEVQLKPYIDEITILLSEREKAVEDWKKILYLKQAIIGIKEEMESVKSVIEEYLIEDVRLHEELDSIEACPICGSEREHWNI